MNSFEATSIFEQTLDWDRKRPQLPEQADAPRLEVKVLCTSVRAASSAMQQAAELARGLNARIHLLVAQEVSYAVPLESPPVLAAFQEQVARNVARSCGVETRVDIFLCRDAEQTLLRQLTPHSVVIVGAPRRWWPTREERLARHLRRAGHSVVVAYRKRSSHA